MHRLSTDHDEAIRVVMIDLVSRFVALYGRAEFWRRWTADEAIYIEEEDL